MKAHSETHFENENMFLEKWKLINPFTFTVHNNNSVRVTQQKWCPLQLLLLRSFRTWRSIRRAGQPELPGNARTVATFIVQKETKKPTKTSTPSSQEASRTTTTAHC